MDLFDQFGDWSWWIIAGIMLIIELAAPTFIFLWFALAAAMVGIIVFIHPLGWQLETLIFVVLSLILLGISRFFIKPSDIETDDPSLHNRSQKLVGKVFSLHEAIEDGKGWVKVSDSIWQVEGPDLPKKTKVIVTGHQNNVLIVEKK